MRTDPSTSLHSAPDSLSLGAARPSTVDKPTCHYRVSVRQTDTSLISLCQTNRHVTTKSLSDTPTCHYRVSVRSTLSDFYYEDSITDVMLHYFRHYFCTCQICAKSTTVTVPCNKHEYAFWTDSLRTRRLLSCYNKRNANNFLVTLYKSKHNE